MGRLTTHVLDTARGRPGAGIAIRLTRLDARPALVAETVTNADGRTDEPLLDDGSFATGRYELCFDVGPYFEASDLDLPEPPFLDEVLVRFALSGNEHYHVPLLVSPWSYSTYRGS